MHLIKWDKAKQAIAECKTIDEVKQIRDKAEALRAYAKQSKESIQVQNDIAEIRLRADRWIGEFSRDLPKTDSFTRFGRDSQDGKPKGKISILQEAGIIHPERYEAIASLPDEVFERHVEKVKASNEELTTVGILKVAKDLARETRIANERNTRSVSVNTLEIRKGDFTQVLSDVYDIDAIITDPPYAHEHIDCFSKLAEFAKNHVKPDGFIAVYSGQYHLPKVIQRLSEHLTYVWTFCLYHSGKKQIVNGINIMCGWKPILIFSNGRKKMRYTAYDVLISENREKDSHVWQQSETGVASLIEILSVNDSLIVDPFSGSGTFGKVCHSMGRRFIGAEII